MGAYKMKPYKLSIGKLINELKLIEMDSKNHKKDLRFIIDCLSDYGIAKNESHIKRLMKTV